MHGIGKTFQNVTLQVAHSPSIRLEPLQNTTTAEEPADFYCMIDQAYSWDNFCIVWYRNGTENGTDCGKSE